MADLKALLERVEACAGPDREIDFWATVLLWEPDPADDLAALTADIELVGIEEMWVAMPFSASLDAALALVERAVPGAEYSLTNLYGVAMAQLPENMSMALESQCARREDGNMPLAILAALLRALLAQPHKETDRG